MRTGPTGSERSYFHRVWKTCQQHLSKGSTCVWCKKWIIIVKNSKWELLLSYTKSACRVSVGKASLFHLSVRQENFQTNRAKLNSNFRVGNFQVSTFCACTAETSSALHSAFGLLWCRHLRKRLSRIRGSTGWIVSAILFFGPKGNAG